MKPPAAHRATTAHLQAAYPFVAEGGLPCRQVYVGRDLFGASFCYDPWELYRSRILTGTNALVVGQIGRGKSALVKCIDEASEVMDPQTGVLRTIADYCADPLATIIHSLTEDGRISPVEVTAKVDVGEADCLEVVLDSGRSVTTTPEHPFLTPNGWQRADQLVEGLDIALPHRLGTPTEPVLLLDEELDFLAVMLAEGSFRPQPGPTFTTTDPEIVERMSRAGAKLGFTVRHRGRYAYALVGSLPPPPERDDGECRCGCGERTSMASRTLRRRGWVQGKPLGFRPGHGHKRSSAVHHLLRLGADRSLAKDKTIPESVFRLPADQLGRFIGVFWMCDGAVNKDGDLWLSLASERMVRQLQHLLLRLGVQSKVTKHPARLNGVVFDAWRLRVYANSRTAFRDQIPLWGRKAQRLCSACERPTFRQRGLPRVSPELEGELRTLVGVAAGQGFRRKEVSNHLGVPYKFQLSHCWGARSRTLRLRQFEALCEVVGATKTYAHLLSPEVFWDRVVSVRPIGVRHVYDLTVEPTRCFVANDVIVHNTYLARHILHGRKGVAFDVKGEYGALADAFGATPVRLAPGGQVRLNPLDSRSSAREQAELVEALAGAALHRLLRPEERTALELALTDVRASATEPTLPLVVERLFDPSPAAAAQVHTTPADLAASAREVALELRRLCEGALAGMFDGPTSTTVDFRSPLVVVDLSGVYHSPALPVVMTCVAAWLQAALAADDTTRRVVVVDEAWRMFSDVAIAAWMQQSFKLSRAFGTQNLLVMHRLSDLDAAGAEGSHQVRLVEGLLADAETRIIYAQPPSEVDRCRELLGLSDTEAALLPQLPRGQALWKVGGRSFLVEHRLSAMEAALVDTDIRMRADSPLPLPEPVGAGR